MSLLGAYKILIAINLEQEAAESDATNHPESATAEGAESNEVDRPANHTTTPGDEQNEGESGDS